MVVDGSGDADYGGCGPAESGRRYGGIFQALIAVVVYPILSTSLIRLIGGILVGMIVYGGQRIL